VVLIEEPIRKASFCRDSRNRHIAHRDLDLALERAATPLPLATRKQVKEALAAIAKVLDYLDVQYMDSTTYWEAGHRVGDARWLLDVLHDGLKAARAREARLQRGEFGEEAR